MFDVNILEYKIFLNGEVMEKNVDIIVRDRDELAIIEEHEDINTEEILEFFLENPRQIVFVEEKISGQLTGIITLGDFRRNQLKGSRLINRNFSKVIETDEASVSKIFQEKKKVSSIPIVDCENRLLKEYVRKKVIRENEVEFQDICMFCKELSFSDGGGTNIIKYLC